LLARQWAAANGGSVIALIVDHGLRAESAAEAALTQSRLGSRGIEARIITLSGLTAGAGMQEAARAARHAVLGQAARAAGAVFLLLGHHAGDQAETVAMRAARGNAGLEGMAGWAARGDVVLLRPLLAMWPEALRVYLRTKNMEWIEDPSNANRRFERVRIRQDGGGAEAVDAGPRRVVEAETAEFLARYVTLRPEGFAVIHAQSAPPGALAALLRVIGGAKYPPRRDAVAALAARLQPATLGGVIVRKTNRFGGFFLLAREPAACAAPIPAADDAVWDNRFTLQTGEPGASFGGLGPDAAAFRKSSDLPSLILQTMPALRGGGERVRLASARFTPPAPATAHPFFA
jgi:tRNA(Ile)-lysidine synthase